MYCKNCGKKVNEDAKFCRECGSEVEIKTPEYPQMHNVPPEPTKQKTSPITWVVFCIVLIGSFIFMYELFSGESFFESKSSKCEIEASERAEQLRDSNLNILKSKTSPTQYELEEIERLESWKEEGLHSRDDFKYYYDFCMDK